MYKIKSTYASFRAKSFRNISKKAWGAVPCSYRLLTICKRDGVIFGIYEEVAISKCKKRPPKMSICNFVCVFFQKVKLTPKIK